MPVPEPIKLPTPLRDGIIECVQDIAKRQSSPAKGFPDPELIAECVYEPLKKRFGKYVADAVCLGSDDCCELLRTCEFLLEEWNHVKAFKQQVDDIYRRIDSIDSQLMAVCRYIPQLTAMSNPPLASRIAEVCEREMAAFVREDDSKQKRVSKRKVSK